MKVSISFVHAQRRANRHYYIKITTYKARKRPPWLGLRKSKYTSSPPVRKVVAGVGRRCLRTNPRQDCVPGLIAKLAIHEEVLHTLHLLIAHLRHLAQQMNECFWELDYKYDEHYCYKALFSVFFPKCLCTGTPCYYSHQNTFSIS